MRERLQGDVVEQQKADWYPDPENAALLRWWDGQQWTDRRITPVLVPEMKQLRDDVRFLRTLVVVWIALTVLIAIFSSAV